MNKAKCKQTEIGEIPEQWEIAVLSDMAELIKEGYKPTGSDNFAYIGLEHIDQQSLRLNSIGHSTEVESNKFVFRSGDILFGKLRPYFRKVYRPRFSGVCSTDIWVVRAKEGTDQGFLFYFMANQDFIDLASSGSSGTRMPRADWDHLKDTVWKKPPIIKQRAIAKILSDLDEKIELNHQMNKTLESIAQAIFKRWFVDFEFSNAQGKPYKSYGGKMVDSELGEIPEGWRVGKLGEYFPIKTGKKDANVSSQNGKYPFFTCAQEQLLCDNYFFNGSAILLAGNCDFNVKWYDGKFEAYQRTYVLAPYDPCLLGYLYYLMKHFLEDITTGHRGSVVNFITKGMIEDYLVAVPLVGILNKVKYRFLELNKCIDTNKQKIKVLSQIRDSLLPRLMSGRTRIGKYAQ